MYKFVTALVLVCHLATLTAKAAQPKLHFSRIDKEMGLNGSLHKSICQDAKGMVWITSSNGVVRYDGMSFIKFKYDIGDSSSVNGLVNDIHLDANGKIWLATPTGVQSFNNSAETFRTYLLKDPDEGIFYSYINSIHEYGKDSLLLISHLDGPILFNSKSGKTEYLRHTILRKLLPKKEDYRAICVDAHRSFVISTKDNGFYFWDNVAMRGQHFLTGTEGINAICLDAYGRFWLPVDNHLVCFDPKSKKLETFKFTFEGDFKFVNGVFSLHFYQNKLFVGTIGDGLLIADTVTGATQRYVNDPEDIYSIPDNGIATFLEDRSHNLWIGTSGNGIAVLKNIQKSFHQDKVLTECDFSRCNFVNAITYTKNGTLWAGMDGGGLNCRRSGENRFTSLLDFTGSDVHGVTSLADGKGEELWVGTFDQGIYKLNYSGKVLAHYSMKAPSANGTLLRSNFIESILVASDGKLWMANNGGGVVVFDEISGTMKTLVLDPKNMAKTISCSDATSFYEDSKHRIWVTTYWGLNLFDRNGTLIEKWVNDEYHLSNLSSNVVNRIVEDASGTFWVATGYGINYFRYGDKSFKILSEDDGLVNNSVYRIEIDAKGNVWAATDEGLSKYDPVSKRFFNFYKFNGLAASTFRKTSYSCKDGKMLFGTENGIISFYPEKIQIDTAQPVVIITAFKLFNKTVAPGKGSVLSGSIFDISEIQLSAQQNYIGFEFAAQSFVDFQKSKFKYRLLGSDQDWTETDVSKRYADYSNLAPGEYTFQVIGTNNDGVWSTVPTEIKINLIPPFYKTALFRFILITAVLIFIFLFTRWRERKLSKDKVQLEKMIEERTAIIAAKNNEINEQNARLLVLNDTKDRFFSIIAHDLKNPLNALMGFSGLLNDKYDDLPDAKKKKFIGVINESSRSMYGLLINLLDWSRSQSGNVPYDPGIYNLQPIAEESIMLITTQAEHKGIHLVNNIKTNYRVAADINMLKTVLRNLLTNAIKFSFRSDTVTLEASEEASGYITIIVKDSGVGMSSEQVDSLFISSNGVSNLGTEKEQGSGLGLIICKEFIELNKGRIWCKSEKGKGTSMYFTIPLA